MSLIVQKYGGTSVGTPDRILKVAGRILRAQQDRQPGRRRRFGDVRGDR